MFSMNKIYCHYCGQRSTYAKGTVASFACATCEAHNYLDAGGNIADPPATHTAPVFRPAQTAQRQTPQEAQGIFCSTCLKNQYFVKENLATYLPDDDHPDYAKFERAYPTYKKKLEQRYPQCCADCAPRAAKQIEQSDKNARFKMLAIMQQRTAHGKSALGVTDTWSKTLKRACINVAGVIWWVSLLTQLMWHLLGVLSMPLHEDMGLMIPDDYYGHQFDTPVSTGIECAKQVTSLSVCGTCMDFIGAYLPTALIAGIFVVWHHPAWIEKCRPFYKKADIEGMPDWFRMQIFMLSVRCFTWYNLAPLNLTSLTPTSWKAVHGFMIFFCLVISLKGRRMVKHRYRALGTYTPLPLIDPDTSPQPKDLNSKKHVPGASRMPPNKRFQKAVRTGFPVHKLAEAFPNPTSNAVPPYPAGYGYQGFLASQRKSPLFPQAASTVAHPSPPNSGPSSIHSDEMDTRPDNGQPVYPTGAYDEGHISHVPLYQRPDFEPGADPLAQGFSFRMAMDELQTEVDESLRKGREAQEAKLRYQPEQKSAFKMHAGGKPLPPAPRPPAWNVRAPLRVPGMVEKVPDRKRKDFMQKMAAWTEKAPKGGFLGERMSTTIEQRKQEVQHEGKMKLRPSTWKLKSDETSAVTGLEDAFMKNVSFVDNNESESVLDDGEQRAAGAWKLALVFGIPITVGTAVWNVRELRRPLFLWIAHVIGKITGAR